MTFLQSENSTENALSEIPSFQNFFLPFHEFNIQILNILVFILMKNCSHPS